MSNSDDENFAISQQKHLESWGRYLGGVIDKYWKKQIEMNEELRERLYSLRTGGDGRLSTDMQERFDALKYMVDWVRVRKVSGQR